MDEDELILRLKGNDENAFRMVYKSSYPMVAKYVVQNKGSHEDAEDIFQEALIVVLKKLHEPDFHFTAKLGTYLYSVGKNMWLYKLRGASKTDSLNDDLEIVDLGVTELEDKKSTDKKLEIIAEKIHDLPEVCRKLLIGFYYKKISLKELAKELKLTEGFIRVKKSRCMETFREIVKGDLF